MLYLLLWPLILVSSFSTSSFLFSGCCRLIQGLWKEWLGNEHVNLNIFCLYWSIGRFFLTGRVAHKHVFGILEDAKIFYVLKPEFTNTFGPFPPQLCLCDDKGKSLTHWTTTCHDEAIIFFYRNSAVIRVLADILRESGKEKVTRIIIAALRVSLVKMVFKYGSFHCWILRKRRRFF